MIILLYFRLNHRLILFNLHKNVIYYIHTFHIKLFKYNSLSILWQFTFIYAILILILHGWLKWTHRSGALIFFVSFASTNLIFTAHWILAEDSLVVTEPWTRFSLIRYFVNFLALDFHKSNVKRCLYWNFFLCCFCYVYRYAAT